MKAWIIAISIMILAGFSASFYYVYHLTAEPLLEREAYAVQMAEENLDLHEVREVNYYHGRRSYQIIDAIDQYGNDLYIWVQENDTNQEASLIVRNHEEGITKEEVNAIANEQLLISRLKSIRLGMIGSTPIYEINYIDDIGRHSFYYVTFEDGTYIRHYQFLKS